MKVLVVVALFALQWASAQKYTDRYDVINVDEVLGNSRLLKGYLKCVLNKGQCTAEGRELKSHIVEALQNGCAKCTKAQREGMRKVIKHLVTKEKEYWEELVNKYDPDRVYTRKYEKELGSI
ncbi:hypothetical protein ACJJTC_016261 [Scirpophaga incertulas]